MLWKKLQPTRGQCENCGADLVTLEEATERLCERHILMRDFAALRPMLYSEGFRQAMREKQERQQARYEGEA